MSSQVKRMRITVEGKSYDVSVELLDELAGRPLSVVPVTSRVEASAPLISGGSLPPAVARKPAGAVASPLSGIVVSVDVSLGATVQSGDLLVTLEAMKMKTAVRAPSGGTVKTIEARPGVAVEEGTVLLTLG